MKLGTVRTISSTVEAPRPRPMVMMKAMAASAAPSGNEEMGFAAGELHYDADVTADFDLTP